MMFRTLLGACLLLAGAATNAQAGEVRYSSAGHAMNPVWSLDGRYIAFEVNNYDDRSDLFVSVVTGAIANDGQKVSLPGGGGPFGGKQVVINPAWHPSGIVVFEGSNSGGQYRLYYVQPGGAAASEMIPTTVVSGDVTFPAMDKKGERMAFIADRTGNGDINIRETSSGTISTVLKTETAEMFPMFNPDGSKILYTRKHNNSEDVFLLDLSTGAESPVAGGAQDQTRPIFAKGGAVLFFDNSRDPQIWDLVAVSAPGAAKKVLARGIRLPQRARPAITPDGAWVATTFEEPAKANSVTLLKVDGSGSVTVPTEHTACGEPALTVQDGRTLLAYTALPSSGADFRRLFVIDITDKL